MNLKINKVSMLLIFLALGIVILVAFFPPFFYKKDVGGELPLDDSATTTLIKTSIKSICDSDGKICPDGSVVGRSGELCVFDACPRSAPPASSPTKSTTTLSRVEGQVTISPICPVERIPEAPECAPRPYSTRVSVFNQDTRKIVQSTQTTNMGEFVLNLVPGDYIIRAEGGAVLPRCEEVTFKVVPRASSSLTISCDSGIR